MSPKAVWMIGMLVCVRRIRFEFLLIEIGMTGWTLLCGDRHHGSAGLESLSPHFLTFDLFL